MNVRKPCSASTAGKQEGLVKFDSGRFCLRLRPRTSLHTYHDSCGNEGDCQVQGETGRRSTTRQTRPRSMSASLIEKAREIEEVTHLRLRVDQDYTMDL